MYGRVPPEKVAVTLPSFPLQVVSVSARPKATAVGWFTVIEAVLLQLCASLTITVCDPLASPLKVLGEVAKAIGVPPSIEIE
jgi:hypothetical protein